MTAAIDAPAASLTPRQALRRSVGWIVVLLIALLVAGIGFLASGGKAGAGIPLDSSNAAPMGSKALAEVLRQQGVDVRTAASMSDVRSEAAGASTVLVYDPNSYLDQDHYAELLTLASTLVVVEPDFTALQALAPSVHASGAASKTAPLVASCPLPAANRAGTISPDQGAALLRIDKTSVGSATGCFPSGSQGYALVTSAGSSATVQLLASGSILQNESIARKGNAALALNLLGEHSSLVWYLPTIRDVAADGPPSLAQLTPGWVTPVVLLLVAVFVAAAVWRGRRFGPLVAENLPVVVRSGETMEGRARLYQRSSARLHALDSLRIGAVSRLAALVGLPSTATVVEVADAVAALTGRERQSVRGLLFDSTPRTDAELVRSSDQLDQLESDARGAIDPTRASNPAPGHTNGRMDP